MAAAQRVQGVSRHYGPLANRGRQPGLLRARALLPAPAPQAPKPELRLLPRCPHCGWAALFLVWVVPPMRFKSAPPIADAS